MIFHYCFTGYPQVVMAYSVTRRTIWKIAEPHHILIYIKKGHCQILTDGKNYILEPGDLFFLPPNCQYERLPFEEEFCEMTYVHFQMPTEPMILNENFNIGEISHSSNQLTFYIRSQSTLKNDFLSADTFEEIVKYASMEDPFSVQIASSCLCRILSAVSMDTITLLKQDSGKEGVRKRPENLNKALNYITQHSTENITLDDLCRVSFVSKQMLNRYFRQEFNQSPMAYITAYKIDRIKQLLKDRPHVSIKEITKEFGFDDQCYFSRIFRKVTGESPSDFRHRVANFDEHDHLIGKY